MRWVLAAWRALVVALWCDDEIDHAAVRRYLSWVGRSPEIPPGSWESWAREEKRRDEWAIAKARVTRLSPTDCRLILDWVNGDAEIAEMAADYAITLGVAHALPFASQVMALRRGHPKFSRGFVKP